MSFGASKRWPVAVATLWVALGSWAYAQTVNPEPEPILPGPYRIAGTVVNAKGGGLLAHTRVTISDVKNERKVQFVITGDDGRFEFHVPAGKYALEGAKRGFINAAYDQHDQFSTAIVTGADVGTENLVLRLTPNAVLIGSVMDEFGDPVRNAQIVVYRENNFRGVSRIFRVRGGTTDDQGRYEVTHLNEGTYFVSANASPWYAVHPPSGVKGPAPAPAQVDPSLDVAYPITYYGDATEAEDATPIPIRGGDRLEADIHMTPVASLHLIVHLAEDPTRGISFPTFQKPTFDGLEQVESSSADSIAPGVYEISGIGAGKYTVQIPDANGQMKEPTEVTFNSSGELDVSSGRPTSKIKATIQVEGAASLPSQLRIGLRNSKGRMNIFADVDAKGEANLSDVIPDRYDILAGSSTRPYSVVRITSEAGSTSGPALNVEPGASLNLALLLVGGSVTVEGFAKRAGKGMPGAMVVLVPKDPEGNRERFRRDQSDLDGRFSLANVIPGSYTIIAIDNGWDLDWAKPAVLARYLEHGQTIGVGDRSQAPVKLTNPVVVQAK